MSTRFDATAVIILDDIQAADQSVSFKKGSCCPFSK
jgi:hypothetical protein